MDSREIKGPYHHDSPEYEPQFTKRHTWVRTISSASPEAIRPVMSSVLMPCERARLALGLNCGPDSALTSTTLGHSVACR